MSECMPVLHSLRQKGHVDLGGRGEHESSPQQTRSCDWLPFAATHRDVKRQLACGSVAFAFSYETGRLTPTQDRHETLIGARPSRMTAGPNMAQISRAVTFKFTIKTMSSVQQSEETPLSSNVVVGSLAPLQPVDLMPERYSRHMKILTKLKQIRQVQVSRGPGNSYIIDVFTTSQSTTRIPTSLTAADSALYAAKGQQLTSLFRRSDVHVEKLFTDFVKLRDELYDACHTGPHLYMNCRFCSEVTRYLLFGAVLPGALLTWMLPQRQRVKAVQRFVESLLQLAVSCPVIDSEACTCQEKLPRQLYKFLFEA